MSDDAWFVCQEENVAALLPQCSTFQEFTGEDATDSADRCYIELIKRDDETLEVMTPDQLATLRPFALVWSDNPRFVRSAAHNSYEYSGEMTIVFEISHDQILEREPTADTESKKIRWAKNKCGQILQELFENHLTIAQQTVEMNWQSHDAEHETEDPAHIVFYVRFAYGFEQ